MNDRFLPAFLSCEQCNLFAVIHYLQDQEGIRLEVQDRKLAYGAVW